MNSTPENLSTPDSDHPSGETPARGADDRRGTVNPAENPAPSSPERDEEATRKGEDALERVKPY